MHLIFFIHHLLDAGARSGLLPFAIVAASTCLEDVAVVFAGVAAASHYISPPIAVLSVMVGVGLSDFFFFGLGKLAQTHPRLRRFVEHERAAPFRNWIHDELLTTVVTARFLPGFRWPTFLACGFFGVPFKRFAPIAIVSDIIWSVTLFTLAYLFGYFTFGWLGVLRWPIAVLAALIAFAIGHARYTKLKAVPSEITEPDTDTRSISAE